MEQEFLYEAMAFQSYGDPMRTLFGKAFGPAIFAVFFFMLYNPILSSGGELYKWKDEEGTLHMTDSLGNVPLKYRDQVVKRILQVRTEPDFQSESPKSNTSENAEKPGKNLNHFEIPYKAFEGTARRIIIPVTFNESVTVNMLMDTGSPGLLISPSLACRLGLIHKEDGNLFVMAGGIGGAVPAMLAVVDKVRVGDASAEFLPATITGVDSSDYEGLVGMDFIANYKTSIDNDKQVVTFSEMPPQAERPGGHDEAWWRSNFQNFSNLKNEWKEVLASLENANMTSSQKDQLLKIAKSQYAEAEEICRKLERYAHDSVVPSNWRR